MPCPNRRDEIDRKAPDVEGIDERDDPLADRGAVVVLPVAEDAEGDGQPDLDQDEGQLDPEGDAQDAVLPVVDAKSLVLPADEDRGDDVAAAVRGISRVREG